MIYQIEKQKSNILSVKIDGDILGDSVSLDLIEDINHFIINGGKNGMIDLSNVRYLNSTGIGMLITIHTKFKNAIGTLVLINPSEQVVKIMTITKLNTIFQIVENENQAEKLFKI